MHRACAHDGRYLRLELGRAEIVGYLHPLAVGYPNRTCIVGIDLQKRVGIQLAQARNLAMLGMEERVDLLCAFVFF